MNHPGCFSLRFPPNPATRGFRLLLGLLLAVSAVGCSISGNCGTWEIEGTPVENIQDFSGQETRISYQPECCNCREVRFIQAVKVVEVDAAGNRRIDIGYGRGSATGWEIDQFPANPRPYYCTGPAGGNDAGYGMPGATGRPARPARMNDTPGVPGPKGGSTWIYEFVTAAVCVTGEEPCQNKILDTIYWSFKIGPDGRIRDAESRTTKPQDEAEFDRATHAYNAQAAGTPPAGTPGHHDPIPPLHR